MEKLEVMESKPGAMYVLRASKAAELIAAERLTNNRPALIRCKIADRHVDILQHCRCCNVENRQSAFPAQQSPSLFITSTPGYRANMVAGVLVRQDPHEDNISTNRFDSHFGTINFHDSASRTSRVGARDGPALRARFYRVDRRLRRGKGSPRERDRADGRDGPLEPAEAARMSLSSHGRQRRGADGAPDFHLQPPQRRRRPDEQLDVARRRLRPSRRDPRQARCAGGRCTWCRSRWGLSARRSARSASN